MTGATQTTRFRFWLWLIALVGVIVPRRLRADDFVHDWRQEWEAEFRYREAMLSEWDRLDPRHNLGLLELYYLYGNCSESAENEYIYCL
ncbi:MAG: hypothetical protein L0229_04070 [Blastocatellia bacterium]|nr:hypothetical protein [Blastocatellia bacterium]